MQRPAEGGGEDELRVLQPLVEGGCLDLPDAQIRQRQHIEATALIDFCICLCKVRLSMADKVKRRHLNSPVRRYRNTRLKSRGILALKVTGSPVAG